MFEIKIYNFCPIGVEIANLMKEIRKINKEDGYRLVQFIEIKEVRRRDAVGCIFVRGNNSGKGPRTRPHKRRLAGCELDCRTSWVTSALIYKEPA